MIIHVDRLHIMEQKYENGVLITHLRNRPGKFRNNPERSGKALREYVEGLAKNNISTIVTHAGEE